MKIFSKKNFAHNVALVIPIYKKHNSLNKLELRLLSHIKSLFSNRSIYLVIPKSLNVNWGNYTDFNLICFNDLYFKDKFSYSNLLCRKNFYESFNDYDYLQIIQTDCWVFEDKLDHFCNLGFDYIGAPWMEGGLETNPRKSCGKLEMVDFPKKSS